MADPTTPQANMPVSPLTDPQFMGLLGASLMGSIQPYGRQGNWAQAPISAWSQQQSAGNRNSLGYDQLLQQERLEKARQQAQAQRHTETTGLQRDQLEQQDQHHKDDVGVQQDQVEIQERGMDNTERRTDLLQDQYADESHFRWLRHDLDTAKFKDDKVYREGAADRDTARVRIAQKRSEEESAIILRDDNNREEMKQMLAVMLGDKDMAATYVDTNPSSALELIDRIRPKTDGELETLIRDKAMDMAIKQSAISTESVEELYDVYYEAYYKAFGLDRKARAPAAPASAPKSEPGTPAVIDYKGLFEGAE